MSYSSIAPKKCKCGCGKWPTLGFKGFNADCQPEMKEEKIKQAKERQKKKNAITLDQRKLRKEDNKLLDGKAAQQFESQQQWFREIIKREKHVCWETGEYIPDKYMRCAVAHILAKKTFKSVATHPLNYLILSAHNGSHQKTDRWDKFQEMRVWDIAVQRFIQIYPFIAKEERKNIPDVFMQEIETKL